jgi:hypothetical protein
VGLLLEELPLVEGRVIPQRHEASREPLPDQHRLRTTARRRQNSNTACTNINMEHKLIVRSRVTWTSYQDNTLTAAKGRFTRQNRLWYSTCS